MRLRNIPGAKDAIEDSRYVIHDIQEKKEDGQKFLGMITLFILKLEWGKVALL